MHAHRIYRLDANNQTLISMIFAHRSTASQLDWCFVSYYCLFVSFLFIIPFFLALFDIVYCFAVLGAAAAAVLRRSF